MNTFLRILLILLGTALLLLGAGAYALGYADGHGGTCFLVAAIGAVMIFSGADIEVL